MKFKGKYSRWDFFGLEVCNVTKKIFRNGCFLVKFAKKFSVHFLRNTCDPAGIYLFEVSN